MSSSIASPQGSPSPADLSPAFVRPAGSSARADLPSVAQLTRRHTAPTTSPERPPKAPNPNRGHFQPYRPVSSPPSSPNMPFRPPSSRVASTSSVPSSQLSLPTQPTNTDPDAEFVHPPFDKRTNYMYIVSAKSPSKFLDQKDFVDENGEVIMEYPYQLEPIRGLGGLKPGPVDDKDVLRCTFCRKQYRGKNSKSMWRRHVQKSHKIKLKNYRERNKENEIEEDFMAATPSRPKLSPYPQLFAAKTEPVQQPVLVLGRMPLLDAVMNKNISPADAKKVAALAVASVTANNPFKMVLKPPMKQEPTATSLPPPPVVKKETRKPARAPAPKPAPEPESPVPTEPEFTLSGSDEDDDTETRRVPCPHADLPCESCVEEYKSLKRGVRRTASFMTLLAPQLPDSPRFDFADGEMSVDVDMDGERSEDEWLYEPGSDAILEPAAPSSPPGLQGLGFGIFDLGMPLPAPVEAADEALASEADSWLQWDAAEPVVATAV